jgi:hypothetical protein
MSLQQRLPFPPDWDAHKVSSRLVDSRFDLVHFVRQLEFGLIHPAVP